MDALPSERGDAGEALADDGSAEAAPFDAASAAAPASSGPQRALLGLACLAFAFSLLSVLPAPVDALWKPAIAATEWGHLLAPFALLPLLGGWRTRCARAATALALLACGLLLSSLARGALYARELPGRLTQAFGEAEPRALPEAPARGGPLVLGEVLSLDALGLEAVEVETHVYREGLSLDLYARADRTRAPVVIVIHGGSWRAGDRTQLPGINRYLAARGYAVAAISYRLAPEHPFPAAHEDVLASIRFVQAQASALRLDATRIALMGRSAGGHLALLAAYREARSAVKGVVAYYPVTDVVWSWENPSNPWVIDTVGILRGFLGGSPDERPQAYRDASPLGFVTPASPPTLTIQGGRDELVSYRQSERLAAALEAAGVAHLNLALPWATHGCEANLAGPSGQLSTYAVERFLAAVLR